MAWTDLALWGEVVPAVKQHWGLTRPDVTTPLVRLTNTDLPSAGFCFTAALFHPHVSPNETRWSFPICCSLLAWNKQKGRRRNSSLTGKEIRFGFVLGGALGICCISECFHCCWTCIQTHTKKKISILFSSSSSSDKHTAVEPLSSQDAQWPQLVLFSGLAESHHAQPSISNFSRVPALPDDVSAKSVASLVSRCRGVPVRRKPRQASARQGMRHTDTPAVVCLLSDDTRASDENKEPRPANI